MENISLKLVGNRIKSLRKADKKNFKQKDFAAHFGIHPSTLSKYEKGNLVPSLEFLLALATENAVSFHWLMLGREHSNSEKGCWIIREPRVPYGQPYDDAKKLIDNLLEILESGNNTVIKALVANIDAFLLAIEKKQVGAEGGDLR
jgi:transcriptional regulator with XRE-family HTH domain